MTIRWFTDGDREAMREADQEAERERRRAWEYDRTIYAWATHRGIALTPELERRLRQVLDAQQ
ncbi:hypothetical protein [Geodermatophilus sp. SYSU D00766]